MSGKSRAFWRTRRKGPGRFRQWKQFLPRMIRVPAGCTGTPGRNAGRTKHLGALGPMKIVKYAAAGSLAGAALLPTGAALAAWELNMPVGVTELSRDIHGLHMLIFWICVLIAFAVFGMMIYSIVKFRHSQGAVPANFDHSTKAKII